MNYFIQNKAICIISFTQISTQITVIDDYVFPEWTNQVGHTMTASLMLGIVLWPIYAIIDALFFKRRSFKSLFTPDFEAFRPSKECDRLTVAISRVSLDKLELF